MRLLPSACALLLVTADVLAQSGAGTLSGTVTDPNGMAVATAQVQLKNAETGATQTTTTTGNGPTASRAFRPAPMTW